MDSKIFISVGSEVFTADFYDSDFTKSLLKQFPMTVSMDDNEGYEYFAPLHNKVSGYSCDAKNIIPGDITLYNRISLSIFCNASLNSSDYVKIGHINNPAGLKKALNRNSSRVTFSV